MRSLVRQLQAGVSLVEVIIGVALVTLIVGTVGYTITSYVDARAALLTDTKALYLTEEGIELVRAVRDDGWSTIDGLTVNTDYSFDLSGGAIVITATPEVIDGEFTRLFRVQSLYRNTDDDIVESTAAGASVDGEGRVFEMRVISPIGTTELETILTNLHSS